MIQIWPTVALALNVSAVAFIVVVLVHAMTMLVLSRRQTPTSTTVPGPLRVVFTIPCLNEERVVGASVDRLLALPYDNLEVLVIDDGSEDATADIVMSRDDPRVRLLRRRLPQARQGKGAALNAAYAHVLSSGLADGLPHSQVIIAVIDADGRLESDALSHVLPFFADPDVGGVQTGVRINNRHVSWLARMQDIEFVTFTDVFQQGRNHIGSVGLGGNGQFMRLSALRSLGAEPWSASLTEDLDLGLRLIAAGWRNVYCRSTAVHQQGVVRFDRLIRQRARWFHGHLQSWKLLPEVAAHTRGWTRWDLLYHMTAPFLLLCASLLTVSFLLGLAGLALSGKAPTTDSLTWLASAYLLAIGPSLAFSRVYWSRDRTDGLTRFRAALLAHSYVGYGLMWYVAGWRAVGRIIMDHTHWAKTSREIDSAATTLPPVAGGAVAGATVVGRPMAAGSLAGATVSGAAMGGATVPAAGSSRVVAPAEVAKSTP